MIGEFKASAGIPRLICENPIELGVGVGFTVLFGKLHEAENKSIKSNQ
jgi:hypothetical protein